MLYANLDSAEILAQEAIQLTEKLSYERGRILAYAALANVRFYQQRLDECQEINEQVLLEAKQLDDLNGQMRALNNIGNCYFVRQNHKKALNFYLASLELEKQLQTPDISTSYLNIGMVYENARNFSKAEEFYRFALQNNPTERLKLHAHINLSVLFGHQKRYQEALKSANLAVEISRKMKSPEGLGRGYSLLSQNLLDIKKPAEALVAADSALVYLNPQAKDYQVAEIQKAEALIELERFGEARMLFERVKDKTDTSYNAGMDQYASILKGLYKLEEKRGNFKLSLTLFEEYKTVSDTVASRHKKQELDRLLTEFETREKAQQIEKLEQENKITALELRQNQFLLLGAGILVIMLLCGGWLFLRQRKLQSAQQILEVALRWRRAQLNPHFFFNALMAVQSLVVQNEGQRSAKALNRFARLMRHVLESSNQERITLEEEVRFLEDYLKLQQLRFEFSYQINLPEDEDPEFIELPAMLLQPFVENAVEHGVAKSSRAEKRLEINFSLPNEHTLNVSVRDNGMGRSLTKASKHISRATEITQDRQQLMQDTFAFEIIDLQDENGQPKGTEVQFRILLGS
ncbi:MAG: tetratricopeptide repeat protein [Bacteroidota bacterium]